MGLMVIHIYPVTSTVPRAFSTMFYLVFELTVTQLTSSLYQWQSVMGLGLWTRTHLQPARCCLQRILLACLHLKATVKWTIVFPFCTARHRGFKGDPNWAGKRYMWMETDSKLPLIHWAASLRKQSAVFPHYNPNFYLQLMADKDWVPAKSARYHMEVGAEVHGEFENEYEWNKK